jgi:flavorubredoxin
MSAVKIAENVHWVGITDADLEVFDIIMPLQKGTTYNAYLVCGSEKAALIDTVKREFSDQFFAAIEEIMPVAEIDYLIVNHTEPDHSGSMTEFLRRAKQAKIICAASAVPFVKNVLNSETDLTGIKDDYQLDLGGKKLTFKLTPYMHWPDTMMEYLEPDGVLFSCDGFAAHLCPEEIIQSEPSEEVNFQFQYYFDVIMRPFTGYIRRNLPKLDGFDIRAIAPSHGPVLTDTPRKYIDHYRQWTADKAEGRNQVTIFYASNYGNTARLAERIGASLEKEGFTAPLVDITTCDPETAKEHIESSRAVLIGTPTFNGDAVKPVWDLVSYFSTVYSIGKKAAVFGSYGWGGEGIKLVAERLAGLKLKVFEENFRARLVPSEEELADLDRYCRDLIEFIRAGKK